MVYSVIYGVYGIEYTLNMIWKFLEIRGPDMV